MRIFAPDYGRIHLLQGNLTGSCRDFNISEIGGKASRRLQELNEKPEYLKSIRLLHANARNLGQFHGLRNARAKEPGENFDIFRAQLEEAYMKGLNAFYSSRRGLTSVEQSPFPVEDLIDYPSHLFDEGIEAALAYGVTWDVSRELLTRRLSAVPILLRFLNEVNAEKPYYELLKDRLELVELQRKGLLNRHSKRVDEVSRILDLAKRSFRPFVWGNVDNFQSDGYLGLRNYIQNQYPDLSLTPAQVTSICFNFSLDKSGIEESLLRVQTVIGEYLPKVLEINPLVKRSFISWLIDTKCYPRRSPIRTETLLSDFFRHLNKKAKTLPPDEHRSLWPLVEKSQKQRERLLMASLAETQNLSRQELEELVLKKHFPAAVENFQTGILSIKETNYAEYLNLLKRIAEWNSIRRFLAQSQEGQKSSNRVSGFILSEIIKNFYALTDSQIEEEQELGKQFVTRLTDARAWVSFQNFLSSLSVKEKHYQFPTFLRLNGKEIDYSTMNLTTNEGVELSKKAYVHFDRFLNKIDGLSVQWRGQSIKLASSKLLQGLINNRLFVYAYFLSENPAQRSFRNIKTITLDSKKNDGKFNSLVGAGIEAVDSTIDQFIKLNQELPIDVLNERIYRAMKVSIRQEFSFSRGLERADGSTIDLKAPQKSQPQIREETFISKARKIIECVNLEEVRAFFLAENTLTSNIQALNEFCLRNNIEPSEFSFQDFQKVALDWIGTEENSSPYLITDYEIVEKIPQMLGINATTSQVKLYVVLTQILLQSHLMKENS